MRAAAGDARGDCSLEERIGYRFTDAALFDSALSHISALKGARNRAGSYQRLEFLGDHVLGLVISDMLYPRFSQGRRRRAVAPARRSGAQGDLRRDRAHHRSRRRDPARFVGSQCRRPQAAGDPRRRLRGADRRGLPRRRVTPPPKRLVGRLWQARMRTTAQPLRDPKTVLAGMGAGARLADAGLSRSRALRPRPQSGIPRRRAAAAACTRRRLRPLQARRRTGRRRRHAGARGRQACDGAMADSRREPAATAASVAASWR